MVKKRNIFLINILALGTLLTSESLSGERERETPKDPVTYTSTSSAGVAGLIHQAEDLGRQIQGILSQPHQFDFQAKEGDKFYGSKYFHQVQMMEGIYELFKYAQQYSSEPIVNLTLSNVPLDFLRTIRSLPGMSLVKQFNLHSDSLIDDMRAYGFSTETPSEITSTPQEPTPTPFATEGDSVENLLETADKEALKMRDILAKQLFTFDFTNQNVKEEIFEMVGYAKKYNVPFAARFINIFPDELNYALNHPDISWVRALEWEYAPQEEEHAFGEGDLPQLFPAINGFDGVMPEVAEVGGGQLNDDMPIIPAVMAVEVNELAPEDNIDAEPVKIQGARPGRGRELIVLADLREPVEIEPVGQKIGARGRELDGNNPQFTWSVSKVMPQYQGEELPRLVGKALSSNISGGAMDKDAELAEARRKVAVFCGKNS